MLSLTFPVNLRRKLVNHIFGSTVSLAIDPAGSHIIDASWQATQDIRHYREKMAQEMADHEDTVRPNFFGKRVWRNWNMDGYVSNRFDWGRQKGEEGIQFAKKPVVKEKPWGKKTSFKHSVLHR
jgi:nucleolar protein 9